MSDTDWIKKLKPGDEVIVRNRYGIKLSTVQHISHGCPTVDYTCYNRKGERSIDSKWDNSHLERPTPETIQNAKEIDTTQKAVALMHSTEVYNISYSQAVRILEILNEKEQPKE